MHSGRAGRQAGGNHRIVKQQRLRQLQLRGRLLQKGFVELPADNNLAQALGFGENRFGRQQPGLRGYGRLVNVEAHGRHATKIGISCQTGLSAGPVVGIADQQQIQVSAALQRFQIGRQGRLIRLADKAAQSRPLSRNQRQIEGLILAGQVKGLRRAAALIQQGAGLPVKLVANEPGSR